MQYIFSFIHFKNLFIQLLIFYLLILKYFIFHINSIFNLINSSLISVNFHQLKKFY